ncbi:carbohydrate esterase family 9 protein [Rickenella mellea]|uniref:Carbohydrate esterase family 9 protein n=1 Tax=Rickenella mellea TaxID=50990 RepID=A0A4Y7Q2R0_9AGAM|nr:carbohydrate esterase family 9 protein [Rickenella mellea]
MEKEALPMHGGQRRARSSGRRSWTLLLVGLTLFAFGVHIQLNPWRGQRSVTIPLHAEHTIARCENLKLKPGPPPTFNERKQSDRFVPGTRPTLIKNATIWTGHVKGLDIVKGDVLLDQGLIKAYGKVDQNVLDKFEGKVDVLDVKGAWVSPGIVDLHSHLGVDSSPELRGASDGNSIKGTIQPWLRSLDGLNTHDDAYHLSISGGVTTALVLPGSANGIGGQAFTIKLRDTAERSPTSKLLEPPFTINGTHIDLSLPPRWRQMKHACGENPSRVYGSTRMDTVWAFRQGYNKARLIKESQDAYCEKALNNEWTGLGEFPEDLQWEALVDVLRGRVKVQVHCYETVDLDDIVRLTNEFQFPIAAFHHAHETYLVPDLLKQAYEHPPAAALFATNARYKREAYRGSEFAPRILADNDIKVVMKSDHPVLNSRYLLYEAQQAHYYGLPANLALAAVTTTSAEVMGMDHRIGYIKEGYDADVVVWDSHPLALGATPTQVFIDGIAQLKAPHTVTKPKSFQKLPETPNFDKEAADALKYEGLPPLAPNKSKGNMVVFTNVKTMYRRDHEGVQETLLSSSTELGVVVVRDGNVICSGLEASCASSVSGYESVEYVDLQGGAISPGLVSFGAPLGLEEISGEASTNDGYVFDPLVGGIPSILGGETAIIRAVDGLQYATRDAYLAYRAGVTTGITSPTSAYLLSGLSTAFSLGAAHKLEKGAILQDTAALHVSVHHSRSVGPSVSTQIATLRRMLLEQRDGEAGKWWKAVSEGSVTLVIDVHSVDIISTLLILKKEVEAQTGNLLKMTLTGATEAHILAKEIAAANVGVVYVPSRPFPTDWQRRRILPGPPLSKDSAISYLLAHNVTVGIGIEEIWSARNTRFDAAWAALEAYGEISRSQALALASSNLEKLLGVDVEIEKGDLVATAYGDLLDFGSKVVGIISPRTARVDLFLM